MSKTTKWISWRHSPVLIGLVKFVSSKKGEPNLAPFLFREQKSIAIIGFMMESVIHAPYEVNRFDLRCVPYDKKKWVDSSPERINLAIFHGALSKGGKKDTVVEGF